jgi:hypothetical protein
LADPGPECLHQFRAHEVGGYDNCIGLRHDLAYECIPPASVGSGAAWNFGFARVTGQTGYASFISLGTAATTGLTPGVFELIVDRAIEEEIMDSQNGSRPQTLCEERQ